jgi:hypothetical protein
MASSLYGIRGARQFNGASAQSTWSVALVPAAIPRPKSKNAISDHQNCEGEEREDLTTK